MAAFIPGGMATVAVASAECMRATSLSNAAPTLSPDASYYNDLGLDGKARKLHHRLLFTMPCKGVLKVEHKLRTRVPDVNVDAKEHSPERRMPPPHT